MATIFHARPHRFFGLILGTLIAAYVAAPSFAQENQADSALDSLSTDDTAPLTPVETAQETVNDPAPTTGPKIEEVVVTATKREQSLRDIPASITAYNGSDLEEKGKLSLDDFLQDTPGVALNTAAPGFTKVVIRGIGTDSSPTSPIPGAVGVFIGDTAFSDAFIANIIPDLSAFDLKTVEVLKGPQGTIFGGSALAGAVRYVLNDPNVEEYEVRGFSQYDMPKDGSQAFTYGIGANLPLWRDKLAIRLAYIDREYPGIYDDLTEGKKDVDEGEGSQFRAAMTFQPFDDLRITFTHIDQDFAAEDGVGYADNKERREFSNVLIDQPISNDFSLNTLQINYDFDFMRVVYLGSLTEKNADVFSDATKVVTATPQDLPQDAAAFLWFRDYADTMAHEIRFQSPAENNFQWLVGAYFYDFEVFFDILVDTLANQGLVGPDGLVTGIVGPAGISTTQLAYDTSLLYAYTDVKGMERAVFFDTSYTFWDQLTVSAGARFYRTFMHGGYIGYGALARAANFGMDVDLRSRITEKGISPRFAVTWDFTEDMSVYAAASRGFRFGGIQSVPASPTNNVPPVYKSDSLWNLELGVRTSWLDKTLNFDVTGFKIYYIDPQIVQKTTDTQLNYTDNVAGAESEGVEVSFVWLPPVDGFQISLVGGYTDAYTTKPFTAASGDVIAPGTDLPGGSKVQVAGTLSYVAALTSDLTISSFVSGTYIGGGYGDIVRSEKINNYGYFDAGVILSGDIMGVRPNIALNVSNIFDVKGHARAVSSNAADQQRVTTVSFNAPRTFNLRASFEF